MLFEELTEFNENLVFIGDNPEQYKKAILGLTHDNGHVAYSYSKLVECMMEENGWSREEAVEWVEYNTLGALAGNYANDPIIIFDLEDNL